MERWGWGGVADLILGLTARKKVKVPPVQEKLNSKGGWGGRWVQGSSVCDLSHLGQVRAVAEKIGIGGPGVKLPFFGHLPRLRALPLTSDPTLFYLSWVHVPNSPLPPILL